MFPISNLNRIGYSGYETDESADEEEEEEEAAAAAAAAAAAGSADPPCEEMVLEQDERFYTPMPDSPQRDRYFADEESDFESNEFESDSYYDFGSYMAEEEQQQQQQQQQEEEIGPAEMLDVYHTSEESWHVQDAAVAAAVAAAAAAPAAQAQIDDQEIDENLANGDHLRPSEQLQVNGYMVLLVKLDGSAESASSEEDVTPIWMTLPEQGTDQQP